MRRLQAECEKAKIVLSAAVSVEINVDALKNTLDFSLNLTREKFNELNQANFDKIIPVIKGCLRDGSVTTEQIDDIILIGGCMRIPEVQLIISNFFSGKNLDIKMNPDEAVAAGAGCIAARLQ